MQKAPKDLKVFTKKSVFKKSLKSASDYYRPNDPGSYLYRILLDKNSKNIFDDNYIELVYVTLAAWNMNSRGAKLNTYKLFKESILQNSSEIIKLYKQSIKDITKEDNRNILKQLFFNLKLVEPGKPPLVTFSKTMHFFLPNLVVPIDRKYTLNYFYGNTNVPKEYNKQVNMFLEIEERYLVFAQEIELKEYTDNVWNRNIQKIMDNMVIGYLRNQEKT